jgi:hypothetical protein
MGIEVDGGNLTFRVVPNLCFNRPLLSGGFSYAKNKK